MAEKLTPQQHSAVHNEGGKLLVSAAAGSGKTKVLVDRLMRYILDPADPANVDDFLIITYTKAAASELRAKIAEKLTQKIAEDPENIHLQRQMQRLYLTKISTVHGFCSEILREYAYRLDIAADFRVADENECVELRAMVIEELLDQAYRNAHGDDDFRAFIDTQGLGRDDRLVPEIIQKVYDSAMCHLDPQGWLQKCLENAEATGICDVSQTVWGKYLMDNLFSYLDMQLHAMEYCLNLAEDGEGLEKIALTITSALVQLRTLRACNSWDEILKAKNIDYGRLTFPRKNLDQDVADQIKQIRNACKKGLEKKLAWFSDPSDKVLEDLFRCAAGTRGLVRLVESFSREYQRAKRSRRVLDFSDLEHRMLDLLLGKSRGGITAAGQEIAARFREIMVDEYQDSNGVQDAIFSALTQKRDNCFMVGDVKQSIYQFRLADPGIFLEKYHSYANAEEALPGQGRRIMLSHNFRSGPEVIESVNAVFTRCMTPETGGLYYTQEEALREGIPHEPLEDCAVELHALDIQEDSYHEEAAFVAQRVLQMLTQKTLIRKNGALVPVTPGDIVILLRSPGSVGQYYQRALEDLGIRCTTGAGADLLQTEEIAFVRALLQCVVNPRQDIPLTAVLASPVFGFSADDLAIFRSKQKKGSVYDALLGWDSPKATQFADVLSRLRKAAPMLSVSGLLQECYRLTQLDHIYSAMPGGKMRSVNLRSFYQLASDYEASGTKDIIQFLEHLDAVEGKGLILSAGESDEAVTIMSIHKSKGLEFPVVILSALAREFNKESLRAQILCDQELGLGLSVSDSAKRIRYPSIAKRAITVKTAASALSEEMRVLYVAMTRARDRLIMTYAPRNLEASLSDVALRKKADGGRLLCAEAGCPGDWVILTAMGRSEAGQLFQLGGHPGDTDTSELPWCITVARAQQMHGSGVAAVSQEAMPRDALNQIRKALSFTYPWKESVTAPSKQTATGRKGREKDEEAAQDTIQFHRPLQQLRKPSFAGGTPSGTVFGNAMHAAMQHLPFEKCTSIEAIREEIQKIVSRGLMTQQQADMVNCDSIFAFFSTEIGKSLQAGTSCVREFKFSILDDGERYGTGLAGEQVLLQGVVDCALLEESGITVIDFKTDYVTEKTLRAVVERYVLQISTYCDAMNRIFEKPVNKALIYLFHLNRFMEIDLGAP